MSTDEEFEKLKEEYRVVREQYSATAARFENAIRERLNELKLKEEAQKEIDKKMDETAAKAKFKIILDVGGKRFAVAKSTLLDAQKDTFFTTMLSTDRWKPEEDGSFFIDRNPKLFALILEFLRTGKFGKKLEAEQMEAMRAELDFYQIVVPSINGLPAAAAPTTNGLKFDVKANRAEFTLTNNNKTVTRNSTGHLAIFGDQGWTEGVHEWTVRIESIVSSYWIAIGVAEETAQQFGGAYCMSSANQLYQGKSYAVRTAFSGDWQTGDNIKVTLNLNEHSVKIHNTRTGRGETITGLPAGRKFFPFFDIYEAALSISFVN